MCYFKPFIALPLFFDWQASEQIQFLLLNSKYVYKTKVEWTPPGRHWKHSAKWKHKKCSRGLGHFGSASTTFQMVNSVVCFWGCLCMWCVTFVWDHKTQAAAMMSINKVPNSTNQLLLRLTWCKQLLWFPRGLHQPQDAPNETSSVGLSGGKSARGAHHKRHWSTRNRIDQIVNTSCYAGKTWSPSCWLYTLPFSYFPSTQYFSTVTLPFNSNH